MSAKNTTKITFKEYLIVKGIKYKDIKKVGYTTLRNIVRWYHDWKYNDNYKWRLPYYPTERTIVNLSKELGITFEKLDKLIQNQYIKNKRLQNKKKVL